MKFKLSAGWLRGQFFHPAGEELDLGDNDDPEFWREHGLLPPPDSCAMDLQAAVVMHKSLSAHCASALSQAERGGWRFEPLSLCRDAWERLYGPQEWETDAAEWGELG